MFYFLFLAVSFSLTYFLLFLLYPLFFANRLVRPSMRSAVSLAVILAALFLVFVIVVAIPDRELGNRALHALGGGFLAFLVCYLAVTDARLAIGRFQFLVFSTLVVTALGVGNEILEFALALQLGVNFQTGTFDTWLDLVSNAVGTAAGALVFVPLLRRNRADPPALAPAYDG